MSTTSATHSLGAFIPVDVARSRNAPQYPPAPPPTIALCRQALVECGALHHLLARNIFAERAMLPIDVGRGPMLELDGHYIKAENGRVRLALISGVLSGTYIVAPFGGRGFMSLGVMLDTANCKLALVERATWTRTVLGDVPCNLPIREVKPRGQEAQAIHSEWVEIPVPDRDLLTWCVDHQEYQRREGSYVVGWPGVLRRPTRDLAVFIKVIKEPEAVACILENERHLRRAASRNPALSAFAPLATAILTQGIGAISRRVPACRPGCAVMLEPLLPGPTLADLASGIARLGTGGKDGLHSRQIAACGRLAAHGLYQLNRHAPRGDRLLAPDATKLDNLICQGIAVDAFGAPVPAALVCPDRDHYISESDPRWRTHGTMFASDVRSLRAMMADSSFDLVEPAHVFQVGRLLLALSTGGDLATAGEAYGDDLDANLAVECRHYARALDVFERRCGTVPSPPASALGALIRACCDPAPLRRPALAEVIERCQRITGLGS